MFFTPQKWRGVPQIRHLVPAAAGLLPERRHDVLLHHAYGACVFAAVGDDDVGVLLRGLYELVVHGLEDVAVLADEHFQRVPAFGDVALDDAQQALVGFRVYEYLEIHLFAQRLVVERHDALYDDDVAGYDVNRFGQARAGDVGVGGLLDGASGAQVGYVLREQRPFEGVGVVEVGLFAYFQRQVRLVVVIRVLRDDRHGVVGQAFHYFLYDGGLAGSCSAGYSDDEHYGYFKEG